LGTARKIADSEINRCNHNTTPPQGRTDLLGIVLWARLLQAAWLDQYSGMDTISSVEFEKAHIWSHLIMHMVLIMVFLRQVVAWSAAQAHSWKARLQGRV
jgi:hypothetical protein